MREMKDSGVEWVGEIPETWHVNALKRIAQIQTGSTPSKKEGNNYYSDKGGIPWIKPENLNSMLPIVNTSEYLNDAGAKIGRVFKPHTTFVACIASVGKTGYSDVICSCNQQINGITFSDDIFWKYGYYALTASAIEHIAKSNTSVQAILNSQQEGYIKLPIPSYDEQRSIASHLDEKCLVINEAIARHQSIIEKLEEYKKSVITQAVTKGLNPNVEMKDSGVEWIGKIPEDWESMKNKYVFSIKKDIAGEEGHTVLSITQRGIVPKDIESNEGQIAASYANYQIVNIGDFAMNHMDLLTGWVDISKYEGVTSPDYRVFKINDDSKHFAPYYLYVMQLCYFNRIFYGLGAGVSGFGRWRLQAPEFKKFKVPVPPIDEQKEIAHYLDDKCLKISDAISRQKTAIDKLEEYKKSLIYNAVTGKIDCRNT